MKAVNAERVRQNMQKTVSKSIQVDCEFCLEFSTPREARFYRCYGVSSRVVYQEDRFVVIPTLGALFSGSLLIVPVEHYETFAQLSESQMSVVFGIVKRLEASLKKIGCPVLFEHGAQSCTGGGCGIYHAHLHLVPLPNDIRILDVFPPEVSVQRAQSISEAFHQLREIPEYLLFTNAAGDTGYVDASASPFRFESQYFRRRIRDHFAVDANWDWRSYDYPEKSVLETLRTFGRECVSSCF